MAKIKNISALGDLEIPSLGIIVLAGETAEVSDDAAALLLLQTDVWVSDDTKTKSSTTTPAPDSPAAS